MENQQRRPSWLRWLEMYGGPREVLRDLHAYGGLLLASVGAEIVLHGAGFLLAGLGLYLIQAKAGR